MVPDSRHRSVRIVVMPWTGRVCVCCLVPGIRHHSVPSRIIVIMAWMAVWENSRKSVTLPPCIDSKLSPSVSKNWPQEGFSNKKWYLVSKTPKRSKCLTYEGKSLCFWDGKSVNVCMCVLVCVSPLPDSSVLWLDLMNDPGRVNVLTRSKTQPSQLIDSPGSCGSVRFPPVLRSPCYFSHEDNLLLITSWIPDQPVASRMNDIRRGKCLGRHWWSMRSTVWFYWCFMT